MISIFLDFCILVHDVKILMTLQRIFIKITKNHPKTSKPIKIIQIIQIPSKHIQPSTRILLYSFQLSSNKGGKTTTSRPQTYHKTPPNTTKYTNIMISDLFCGIWGACCGIWVVLCGISCAFVAVLWRFCVFWGPILFQITARPQVKANIKLKVYSNCKQTCEQ